MLAAASSSPSFSVDGWMAALLAVGAMASACVAIALFFRRVMMPVITAVAEMRKDYPVWVDIAEKFGSDGTETITTELRALASNDEVASANQKTMLSQLELVIAQQKATDAKLSETRHKIIGEFASLEVSSAGAKTLVEAIVRTSEELQAVRTELQQMQRPATD